MPVELNAAPPQPTPDPHQRAVIDHPAGALVVLAPAGSGKTMVMTERLARAVAAGENVADTLCVTFTNRAASEMRERVARRLGPAAADVRVMTFHALCAWILRMEARAVGYPQDFVIYDEVDCIELLRTFVNFDQERERTEYFHAIQAAKSGAAAEHLSLGRIPDAPFAHLAPQVVRDYHRRLQEQHAVDFADLVYRVRAILARDAAAADRWRGRFPWLQVDEVQDTHHSEFDVIRTLGHGARSIALYGDLDQTIYEWRGSDPDAVLAAFDAEFGPIRRFDLRFNYRSTQRLVELAERFKASFERPVTRLEPAASLPQGERPVVVAADDVEDEATAIARHVRSRRVAGERIGVLAPTHRLAAIVSAAFTEQGIDHVTVEQFEFFRRQEIKDVLAYMRLLLNPRDDLAARRIVQRPRRGIGEAILKGIRVRGPELHVRLSDMLAIETHEDGEPYGALLGAWRGGTVVVLDVESTGLDTARDEVVEVAAVRRRADGTCDEFHRFVRPGRPVGESQQVHGHTDAFLAEHGEPVATVLAALLEFAAGAVIVAHNASYDLDILCGHGRRAGLAVEFRRVVDTYDVATRLWRHERYTLAALCEALDTPNRPTHRALDDVRAALDVLGHEVELLGKGAVRRARAVASIGEKFLPLARQFETWRREARVQRPEALVRAILRDGGLLDHYRDEPRRVAHLEELLAFLAANDRPEEAPRDALARLARTAALARNVDHVDEHDRRIPIITIHQAKGLEFDGVYVAGVVESGIPSYFAIRDDTIEEQRRLFYVALTRPRRWIRLSWSRVNANGYRSRRSRFLDDAAP